MFSVYGKAGRIFRGAMEELRHVGPISRVSRTQAIAPVGLEPQDQNPQRSFDHALLTPTDAAHRLALSAYEQTRKPGLPRQPLTRVESVMSHPVVTIAETSSVAYAWQLLADHQIGQAPVVTERGVLVGLMTRSALLPDESSVGDAGRAHVWDTRLLQKVADVMWSPVPSVSVETDIRRVARVLLDTGLPGLPVVDETGHVSGFVSRSDILRAVVADPPLDLWT